MRLRQRQLKSLRNNTHWLSCSCTIYGIYLEVYVHAGDFGGHMLAYMNDLTHSFGSIYEKKLVTWTNKKLVKSLVCLVPQHQFFGLHTPAFDQCASRQRSSHHISLNLVVLWKKEVWENMSGMRYFHLFSSSQMTSFLTRRGQLLKARKSGTFYSWVVGDVAGIRNIILVTRPSFRFGIPSYPLESKPSIF